MMRNTVFFVLATVAAHLSSSWAAPGDLEVSEIAPYTVIKAAKTYETRSYAPMKWVCSDHVGTSFRNRDQARSFFSLFNYISGQNSDEVEIDMTAPVSILIQPNADAAGNTLYQMCFYIPNIHQESPPQPTGEGVYIENRPALTLAARQFGGFIRRQADWLAQMEILRTDLKAANEQNFDYSIFYEAGYDSPMKSTNRRNEIWVLKTE